MKRLAQDIRTLTDLPRTCSVLFATSIELEDYQQLESLIGGD